MTGLTGFNLDSFNLAELALKEQGHEVRNPACLGHGWADYEHYMELDLVMLGQCEAIVFLPGSEKSPGAQREAERAKTLRLGSATPLLRDVWDALILAYIKNGGTA